MDRLDSTYSLCYLGHGLIHSYFTDSTLPWIIAEVELSRRLQNVTMLLTTHGIKLQRDFVSRIPSSSSGTCTTPDGLETLNLMDDLIKFDDDAVGVEGDTRCLPNVENLVDIPYNTILHTKKYSSFFVILSRDSKDKPIYCHTFKAETNAITIISNDIEKRILFEGKNGLPCIFSKSTNGDSLTHSDNDSVRFEVMLVGMVNLKNPDPPHTLIDLAVVEFADKSKQLEQRRNEIGQGDHFASHVPASPVYIDSGSPPSSYMDDSREGSLNVLRQMRQRCSSFEHASAERPSVRHRQRHSSEPSSYANSAQNTRIRLFQIGHNSIRMICPNKAVRTHEIEFSNISRCMQGIKHLDHFGMIANSAESPRYNHDGHHSKSRNIKKIVCYVFKCADENVCEEIMQGIRQAFATCFNETSPMQEFDLLCKEINAATPQDALSVAKCKMRELGENEIKLIKAQIMEVNPKTHEDKLAACMAAMRQLYEVKHIKHIADVKAAEDLSNNLGLESAVSKFDNIKIKAMTSLGNFIQKGKKKMQELQLDAEHLSEKRGTSPVQKLKHFSEASSNSAPTTPQKNYSVLNESPNSTPSSLLTSNNMRTRSTSLGSKPQSMEFNSKKKSEPPFLFYHRIFHNITNTGPYLKSTSVSTLKYVCDKKSHEKPQRQYKTADDIRKAWKWAIRQQMLLNRINDIANTKPLENIGVNGQNEYTDLKPVPEEMEDVWMELFRLSAEQKDIIERKVLRAAVKKGIIGSYRGRLWKLLRIHCHDDEVAKEKPEIEAYPKLLDNLTPYQHAILIDIGRTFPTHPMYCQLLGPGQLSLFNVLKAYSLLDKEVGYCQGLSFIAGVLLMHTCVEDEAYQLLYCIMHEVGCRSMYLPDMKGMKLAMYKMTRLLYDTDNEIFRFFEKHEVTMMLVATPWFLTMYASTFPMGFVARVFDMVFVDGTSALFKVAICLLQRHKPKFLQFDDFEDIVNYIKTEIPQSNNECLSAVVEKAMAMSIDSKLQEYEVEYRILCEELPIAAYHAENQKRLEEQTHCLENVNHKVTESNCDLLKQLHDAQQKVAILQKQLKEYMKS